MPAAGCSDPLVDALARKAEAGTAGAIHGRSIASGAGWRVVDFVCTCGCQDPPADEEHRLASISLVLAGTFTCRSRHGSSLLLAGSLFLGSTGETFECSHEYGEGDRCLSFQFQPALLEEIARDAGARAASFGRNSLPPLRALAPLVARAIGAEGRAGDAEETAYQLAGAVLRTAQDADRPERAVPVRHLMRAAELVRHMERSLDEPHAISDLSRLAGMSPYHLIRAFKAAVGVTPHQWLLRARLRVAAQLLQRSGARVTDIALEVGFPDLSNFIRSFRVEFGVSPRQYRAAA